VWPQQPPDEQLHLFVDVLDGVDVVASSSEYFISLSFPTNVSILNILSWWPCHFTVEDMHPTQADGIEFTMTLPSIDNWPRLSAGDLAHNNVTLGSTSHLREFQERLRRKRYIYVVEDVRAVIASCRPAHLRCSRHIRRFGGPGSSQRLRTLISRASSQWKLAIWTT